MNKKIYIPLLLFILCAAQVAAQMLAPIRFSTTQKRIAPDQIEVSFVGQMDAGWHVYGTDLAAGGPTSATFNVEQGEGVTPLGKLQAKGKVHDVFDKMFSMQVRYYTDQVTFVQRFRLTQPQYRLQGYLEYGACDDQSCLPPTAVNVTLTGSDGPEKAVAAPLEAAQPTPPIVPTEKAPQAANTPAEGGTPSSLADSTTLATAPPVLATAADSSYISQIWQPVLTELQQLGNTEAQALHKAWWVIFLLGFGGGLLALFTPCVWPIIPMTVSFFLKRGGSRRKGIRDALTYGTSIIIIYVSLGLIITYIFGPNALNDLATNAVFNLLFFAMLIFFGASFLGGFEIQLPSRWSQAVDGKAERTTGFLSIFLMAFTLSLVSFSCTGPIIGFLLVEVATSGSVIAPTIGMLGFALALALPFTLFALFPSWLKNAPKSGGWMNVIKVSLGILEIAFALKFLSVADLAYGWHILDREVFLVLWIVLFALLGVYLLGKLRFPHDDEQTHTSVPRFFMGVISLAFAIYMIPGLWGAPLKAISAFAPPLNTQDFKLNEGKNVEPQFKDYEAGMAYAKQVGKPVMVDFTGFGCVNCRKMEIAVWHDARVHKLLTQDYVLISLYVDDKTKLPTPIEVTTPTGEVRRLRTIGDKWSYLQSSKFGYNAQPFYVLLDNEGKPLTKPYTYDEHVERYITFLEEGRKVYAATQNNHK